MRLLHCRRQDDCTETSTGLRKAIRHPCQFRRHARHHHGVFASRRCQRRSRFLREQLPLTLEIIVNPQAPVSKEAKLGELFTKRGLHLSDEELSALLEGREQGVGRLDTIIRNAAPSLGSGCARALAEKIADGLMGESLGGQARARTPRARGTAPRAGGAHAGADRFARPRSGYPRRREAHHSFLNRASLPAYALPVALRGQPAMALTGHCRASPHAVAHARGCDGPDPTDRDEVWTGADKFGIPNEQLRGTYVGNCGGGPTDCSLAVRTNGYRRRYVKVNRVPARSRNQRSALSARVCPERPWGPDVTLRPSQLIAT